MKKEEGNVGVLFAIMLAVLIGFVGLGVDSWNIFYNKSKAQNALDSSVLAGAQELAENPSNVENVIKDYGTKNGLSASNISVRLGYNGNSKQVYAKTKKTVDLFFLPLIGLRSFDVSVDSVAEVTYKYDPVFDYILFSGSKSVPLATQGNLLYYGGNVHTNDKFTAGYNTMTITGVLESSGGISLGGQTTNVQSMVKNSSFISMPDFVSRIKSKAKAIGSCYVGNTLFNGNSVDLKSATYVDGNLSIATNKFTGVGCILATGTITFNQTSLFSANNYVCLYSANGDIIINGNDVVLNGILYAPHGKIVINATSVTVNGRLVANSLGLYVNTIKVVGGTEEYNTIPYISVGSKIVK